MKNKKRAGFKMKKSPNKFFGAIPAAEAAIGRSMRSQAKIDPRYYMPGGPGEGQPIPSDTGGPSRPNPYGRPRGPRGNMKGGQRPLTTVPKHMRPEGIFGRGKFNTPRHIMAALGGNVYGRPTRRGKGGQRPTRRSFLEKKGGQRPTRRPDIPNPRVRGGRMGGDPRIDGDPRMYQLNERPNPYAGMANPYEGGGTMGQDNIIMNAAPMAKKSGFTMKRGGKPNKSEFFKGKK